MRLANELSTGIMGRIVKLIQEANPQLNMSKDGRFSSAVSKIKLKYKGNGMVKKGKIPASYERC